MTRQTMTFDGIPYWYMEVPMDDGNVLWIGEHRINIILSRYEKYDPKYGWIAKWVHQLFDLFVPDWLLTDCNREEFIRHLNRNFGDKYNFVQESDRV